MPKIRKEGEVSIATYADPDVPDHPTSAQAELEHGELRAHRARALQEHAADDAEQRPAPEDDEPAQEPQAPAQPSDGPKDGEAPAAGGDGDGERKDVVVKPEAVRGKATVSRPGGTGTSTGKR